MSTTVQTQKTPFYSDYSEYFYTGLKRDDTKDYSLFKKLIFGIDSKTEFDRIDTNHDGVLQKAEITGEIYNDINSASKTIKRDAGLGLSVVGLSYLIRKHSPKTSMLGLVTGLWDLGSCIYYTIQKSKLQERIANGAN